MKLVNYRIQASVDDVTEALYNSEFIVSKADFGKLKGAPRFHIKEKNSYFKIKCEYTGGATKDNAFLEGTWFLGKLSQRDDKTSMKGIIVTAPIYHLIVAVLFGFYVIQCISLGGFTPIPIILLAFSIYMFKDEFKKQGIIKKYIFQAFKNTFAKLNQDNIQKIH